jgi:TrmH family RNA methyltransferase
MGALFQVPLARIATVDGFFDWAAARAVTVFTTSTQADQSFWAAPYQPPLAFLLGSEGRGLPAPVLARGHHRVQIPIAGRAESLNLAVAAGILLYEARRRSPYS